MKPTRTKNWDGIQYTLNGKLHRTNGPAIIWNDGDMFWYKNGTWCLDGKEP